MMSLADVTPGRSVESQEYSRLIDGLLRNLFPICRSITGDGIRETLRRIAEHVPLDVIEVPSGTEVFDWVVPPEWNISDAWIKNSAGERVVDFRRNNLHVVSYSVPVPSQRMTRAELLPHLHTLPSQRHLIPYLTTYYNRDWGFCLSHADYELLTDDSYEVCIESSLEPGSLTLAEAVLPGETQHEVLLSTYCCHPSMANNELSGPVLLTALYVYLSRLPRRRFTYRFYWGPETIGAIAYLSLRGEHLRRTLVAGLVATCCGDAGAFTYKRCRSEESDLNRVVEHVLRFSDVNHRVVPFFPTGSDERQFSSPGFNLPIGSIMRSMYATYPEYHTSADNLEFVSASSLLETLRIYVSVMTALEQNRRYLNQKPFGEPHLGKYGLYRSLGGGLQDAQGRRMRFILNFSDGGHDLVDIAERAGEPIWALADAVDALVGAGLLTPST